MHGIQEYIKQITDIFGQDHSFQSICNLPASPIANAFSSEHSNLFKSNFINCLKRLNSIYSKQDENRTTIISLLKKVGLKRNWAGAYAELSAYDYLNFEESYLLNPVSLNKSSISNTLARYSDKGKHADLDCYFDNFDVYMDVKVLADNARQLLNGIYDDLRQNLVRSDFYITEEYSLDIDYEIIKHKRNELLDELINRVKSSNKPDALKSKVIPQISFEFHWEPGTFVSFKFYNPYRHAQAHHKLAFKHYKKFVEDKPFLLLFVIFPWFNGIIDNSNDDNKIFYRSFSRRVFCQYIHDSTQFKTLNADFNSNLTINSVSKKLSGIMFLEDHSITSNNALYGNYSAFVYLNPNAENSIIRSTFHDYLRGLPNIEYDDFEFDNY